MELPNWVPEQFKTYKESLASSPHKERLQALLSSENMRSVWPKLKKKAKNPEDTPDQKNPLDMYLFACLADQWKSSGLANGNLRRQAETLEEAAKHLRRYVESIKLLGSEIQDSGSIYGNLLMSARSLGMDTTEVENLSEPELLPLLEKKLDNLVRFHEAHAFAIRELMDNEFSKSGASGEACDARILALRRTLLRCTRRYFWGPCLPQVAVTVNVIAKQLGVAENCTASQLRNTRL